MVAEVGEGGPASPSAVAAAGLRAGKPLREIAVDLYGRERVDADWHADSRMRSKLRRLVQRARATSGGAGSGVAPESPAAPRSSRQPS